MPSGPSGTAALPHDLNQPSSIHPPPDKQTSYTRDYPSLRNPPSTYPGEQWVSSIYRGLVPAKNISCHDFAINGAVYTPNHSYTSEVASHWISSYFLRDSMRLPSSVDEALAETELKAAWMRKCRPSMLTWDNESYSSGIALWNWPQVDELLEDMYNSQWYALSFAYLHDTNVAFL
ncbi:hypothetical protein BJ138DRAFT_1117428 [Hygrophoropsis aurantiaca]|uniref:Uncharacterized protein n=1 Tax=Hygrophoropsis aurantiaca TaxID=72124 RepID=A0ACB7ZZN0_9AGAM|nr:hypothetical protein BJ138DRAFT_1117428 [Hygrophoropsis aurantiaca]